MSEIGIAKAEQSHIWQRQEHEHYVEPEWCSRRLFEVEQFEDPIWDPCCGFGRIVQAAQAAGHIAHGTDIVVRSELHGVPIDFFARDKGWGMNIVCNPPFKIYKEFALHALQLVPGKVAMIAEARRLAAARWLQETPLARIWLLTPRPSMPPGEVIARGEKPGGGKQDFCWLVWDRAHKGPATIGWLHRDAAP